MSIQDWFVVLIGGGLLSAGSALLAVWLQNRHAAALQDKQWARERQDRADQWQREREERYRTEAIAVLSRHLDCLQAFCDHMTAIFSAAVDPRSRPRIDDLCFGATKAAIDARVAADVLSDQRITDVIDRLFQPTMEAVSSASAQRHPSPSETTEQRAAAQQAATEAGEWVGVMQALVTQIRLEIIKDPFSRAAEGLRFLGPRIARDSQEPGGATT